MLSPGYCFRPEDDELIVDYLNKEINRERPEYIRCIRNVNVYDHSPEDLTRMYQSLGKGEWYFFTSRERKYLNGKRPNRAAGNGYWKATVADKKILANGVHVGFKKTLVFFVGKPSKGHKTGWIMHEYVSKQPTTQIRTSADDPMRLDDCVMCRIHKKYSKTEEETESSETWNQAAPKSVKTEHMATNQQQQLSLEVTNFNSQQNQQQAIHGQQLHFGPESQQANTNPDEEQAIMDEDILQYINFD
ncbi:NAC domain-containing protein 2-like isoform X2 [Henckelia pumila]